MAFSSRVALLWIVSMSSNRFPLSAIFNFGNIQKSQGAMSRLCGGWRSCTILCFAKNCCTRFDECAGALSWSRSQSPLDQKRGRYFSHGITQSFQNFNVIFVVDRLTFWSTTFVVHNTLTIEKNNINAGRILFGHTSYTRPVPAQECTRGCAVCGEIAARGVCGVGVLEADVISGGDVIGGAIIF